MSLIKVIRGSFQQANMYFRDTNGIPIVGTGAPTFTVYDFEHNFILQGVGLQDQIDPSLWTGIINIPKTAPVSIAGERYQIAWNLPTDSGTVTAFERFEVYPEGGDPIRPIHNTDVLMVQGGQLVDSLMIDGDIEPGSLSYKVLNVSDDVVFDAGDLTTLNNVVIDSKSRLYQFASPEPIPEMVISNSVYGLQPYLGRWTYKVKDSNIVSSESHPIYVVNNFAVNLADKLRKLIDRAKLGDIHPFLQWTDMDLIHYLIRGLDWYNSQSPQVTSYTLSGFNAGAIDLVVKAAAVEALRAQYLAEGMSSFDFVGQGVTLNVDRTQYEQTLANDLFSEITAQVKSTKRTIARSSGPAVVLGISIGAYTNGLWLGTGTWFGRNPLNDGIPKPQIATVAAGLIR